MDTLTRYCNIYERLHNYRAVPSFALSPIRRLVRKLANKQIPRSFEGNEISRHTTRSDIIVSLTSFPARIDYVYLVVECFLRQTVLPQKIVLWLAKSQFPDGVPVKLSNMTSDRFEIRYVENDFRSHKKYLYALREYPDNWILIVDDDIYYPSDTIEKMILAREKYPNSVICRYASPLVVENGTIPPDLSW